MRFVGALCPTNAFSLLIGALFFYASLTPSLMPRGAVVQGALAGILAVVGYGVGQLLQWLRAYFEIPEIPPPWRVKLGRASLVLCVVIVLASTWKAADWQNSTRAAVDLPPVSTSHQHSDSRDCCVCTTMVRGAGLSATSAFRPPAARTGRATSDQHGCLVRYCLLGVLGHR